MSLRDELIEEYLKKKENEQKLYKEFYESWKFSFIKRVLFENSELVLDEHDLDYCEADCIDVFNSYALLKEHPSDLLKKGDLSFFLRCIRDYSGIYVNSFYQSTIDDDYEEDNSLFLCSFVLKEGLIVNTVHGQGSCTRVFCLKKKG